MVKMGENGKSSELKGLTGREKNCHEKSQTKETGWEAGKDMKNSVGKKQME